VSASDSTLIYFSSNDSTTFDFYNGSLNEILATYSNNSPSTLQQDCGENMPGKANFTAACAFNISVMGSECSSSNLFGYASGKPCVMLRINKIYEWDPTPYLFDNTTKPEIGSKQYEFNQLQLKNLTSNYYNQTIPVSCEGENDGDVDNIISVQFYPENGFPATYFPYENQPNYQPPAVMAQFNVIPGRAIMIWCRIWTTNIIHNLADLQGSYHLELYVTNNATESSSTNATSNM